MGKAVNARTEHTGEGTLERLEALCRERGQRLTRQRRAVLRKLVAEGRALSAYELLARLRPEDSRSTPAGVYRALEFLMEAGVVHRLESTRSFILCEHPDAPHRGQLLICRACGQVVEAEDERVAAATGRLGKRLGFSLDPRVLELTGVCAGCRARGAAH
ncbi:MAG: Fur family transcriptional regulator [Steroidobacteraceae bacterium]